MNAIPVTLVALASLLAAGCERQSEAVARESRSDTAAPTSAEGRVVAVGEMGSARADHTATDLADGRILIAGGFVGDESSAAGAELYDPATGAFSTTGPMATPRYSHSATRLLDGRVLLAGGYGAGGEYLRTTEIYDPATGSFTTAGAMTTARAGHATVALRDGRVLMAGGVGTGWSFLSSAEIYDPATGTFSATGEMNVPRDSHTPVLLPDGRVLVIGGHVGRRSAMRLHASAEAYDPATGRWTPAGEMTVPRHKHDAVLLPDGRVLITGGTDERDSRGVFASAELFDPATGASRPTSPMRLPRYKHQGTSRVLGDGRVLIAGGARQAEIYDPASGAFRLVGGEAGLTGQFSAIAPLPDGGVLITGGYGEEIRPGAGAWVWR